MGRHKIFFQYDDPITVVRIVEAIVSDVPRKERAITYSAHHPLILEEYARVNKIVYTAIDKIEPELCKAIMHDIIDRIGYERSKASIFTSKGAYYRRKRMFIHDIAEALKLI
jgi:hypothetical protein